MSISQQIQKTKQKHDHNWVSVYYGLESTGHYWNIYFRKKTGFQLWFDRGVCLRMVDRQAGEAVPSNTNCDEADSLQYETTVIY